MPFNLLSLPSLRMLARNYMAGRIVGFDPTSTRTNLGKVADAVAALTYNEQQYLGWQSQQLLYDTAESDYLDRWARDYGLTREGATSAGGNITLYGSVGTSFSSGLALESQDGTLQFQTQAAGTITSSSGATVPVVALTTGSAANLAVGGTLVLVNAYAGLLPNATIAADANGNGLTGGLDTETDDALRIRLGARVKNPPQGGAGTDYVAWAKLVPGVTRVWVYPLKRGIGTVDIIFVMDARADIIPLAADVAAVQASINTYRNVTSNALVYAPPSVATAVTIANLVPTAGTTLAAAQASIKTSLALLFSTTTPGQATIGDGVSTQTPGGTTFVEAISSAIATSAGVATFDLIAPTTDIVMAITALDTLGTVTFQ